MLRRVFGLWLVACGLGTDTPAQAALIDDFEDGDATNNPTWAVVYGAGPHSVEGDPIRAGNLALREHGSDGAHHILTTTVDQGWQGFAFEVEFMATGNYGPVFVVNGSGYRLGTRFPIATTDSFANGRWYIADNANNSPEWWARDPGAPAFVLPLNQWVRIQIFHNPTDGLIHGRIIRVSDGAVMAERIYAPSAPVPASQITSFEFGTEETPWQYVDNIRLAASTDCNANGTPDDFESLSDCNDNGTPDNCESLQDCDANGTPDACEGFVDCNANGTPDACEIAGGTSTDCNSNGVPDDCDLEGGAANSQTVLLLHADGAGSAFLDSSSSAHALTANGEVTQSAPAARFGPSGMAFDGNGDFLSSPSSADWNFGTGDFTIDFWINPSILDDRRALISDRRPGIGHHPGVWSVEIYTQPNVVELHNGYVVIVAAGAALPTGLWTHVALVRAAGVLSIYYNGALQNSAPDGNDYNNGGDLLVGRDVHQFSDVDGDFSGFIDELRISKGVARWTANFIPPAAPYSSCVGSCATDCNSNGVLDDCEALADCNANGTPDACDIGNGTSADCNTNGTPDECDIAAAGTPPQNMVLISAGEFQMGDTFNEGSPNEQPVHAVYVDAFYMDTYEVTNQRYADALNWAMTQNNLITVTDGVVYKYDSGTNYPYCDTTVSSSYSRITWNGSMFGVVSGKETHPIVMVSWCGSVAYANWRSAMAGKPQCYDLSTFACDFGMAGYRLLTEAEWEKAAGWDPVQQWHFRFGEHTDGCGYNCLSSQRVNYLDSGDPFESGAHPWTTPVGYYNGTNYAGYQTQDAKSYYGAYDLSGNVWEWCNDWYSDTYYSSSPGSNPIGPTTGAYHVNRGGSWPNTPSACRSAIRNYATPGLRDPNLGFRLTLPGGTSQDCNDNDIPDECESLADCNSNGTADACEAPGAPQARVVGVVSRKSHEGLGPQDIAINVAGSVAGGNVTSEPRIAGIFQLFVTFDAPPGEPGPNPVTLQEQRCPGGAWEPYSGSSSTVAGTNGNTLVLGFTPPLENARTYRLAFGPPVTGVLCQSLEVRSLTADANSDGRVNAGDRSAVVGIWTGPGYSARTDINLSGRTDAGDRSMVVGAWTGTANCAP